MITVNDIFSLLCDKYPLETACDFDNAGFLVGDGNAEVHRVLVTLDCTLLAIEQAQGLGAELIITHHPVIWTPLKAVTADTLAYRLIKAGIAVISMHTNLDIATGGVTDCLCRQLGLNDVREYTAQDGFLLREALSPIEKPEHLAEHIKQRLNAGVKYVAGKREIHRVLVCSGSGGSYLNEALQNGFDALITADVKHDCFVAAANAGISLFDAGHFATEDVIIDPLCEMLATAFGEVSFTAFHPDYIKTS